MKLRIERYNGPILGLPETAIPFTNSERADLICSRRWWFRHPEALRSVSSAPQRYGTAWHLVMESWNSWLRDFDSPWPKNAAEECAHCGGSGRIDPLPGTLLQRGCSVCSGSGLGPVGRAREQWKREVGELKISREEMDHDLERLARAIEGYSHRIGFEPSDDWKVIGVEMRGSAPIRDPRRPDGHYCPETYLAVLQDGTARLARTGEAGSKVKLPADVKEVILVRWPMYVITTMDLVLAHRKQPWLAVGEFKSTDDPQSYLNNLRIDPQVLTYGHVLQHLADQVPAELGFVTSPRVDRCWYDIASSHMQRDPELLAGRASKAVPDPPSPGFSVRQDRIIPTWRWDAAIKASPFDPTEEKYVKYREHLRHTVDPKLYIRYSSPYTQEEITSYGAELYGVAVRIAKHRRDAATATQRSDIAIGFPRTPVCRMPGGTCSYKDPCASDVAENRAGYIVEGAPPVRNTDSTIPISTNKARPKEKPPW